MQNDHNALFQYFDQALDSADPFAYAAGLQLSEEMRQRLSQLLTHHFEAPHFLEALVIPTALLDQFSMAQTRFQPGDLLDDFQFIGTLGEGSFGVVYHVKQLSLDREVALKVTPDFGDEARTLARLEHDHIVPIFSQSANDERHIRMLCMPLLPGITLGSVLKDLRQHEADRRCGSAILQRLSEWRGTAQKVEVSAIDYRMRLQHASFVEACLMIMVSVADAVAFAHARGVLHLDIKPDNILFDIYGRPKLADFNVSVSAGTRRQVVGGTRAYMSLEQARAMAGESVDVGPASDVYALGRVLSECLNLAPEWQNLGPIKKVVQDAVSQDAERRPSADAFAQALKRCLGYLKMRAHLPKSFRGQRWAGQHLIWAIAAVTLIPNLIGSVVNIRYNALQIAAHLTELQVDAFRALILGYNILIYPFIIVLVVSWVRRCLKSFSARDAERSTQPLSVAQCRDDFATLSRLLIGLSSLGWLAGAVVFPIGIDMLAGPLPVGIYVHFAISFVVSWLIAMTYSYLGLQFILTRTVYPELMDPLEATEPLPEFWSRIERTSRFMLTLAVFIPLIGAVMVLFMGFEDFDPQTFFLMKVLISSLIAAGLGGFLVAFYAFDSIKRSLEAIRLRAISE